MHTHTYSSNSFGIAIDDDCKEEIDEHENLLCTVN